MVKSLEKACKSLAEFERLFERPLDGQGEKNLIILTLSQTCPAFMCQLGKREKDSKAQRGFLTTFGSCGFECEIVAMVDWCTCVDSSFSSV